MERQDDTWEVLTPSSSTNSIASPSSPYVVVRAPMSNNATERATTPSPQPPESGEDAAIGTAPGGLQPWKGHGKPGEGQTMTQDQNALREQLTSILRQPHVVEKKGTAPGEVVAKDQESAADQPDSQKEHAGDEAAATSDQPRDTQQGADPGAPDSNKDARPFGMPWKLVLSWPFMLPLVLTTLAVAVAVTQITMRRPHDVQSRGGVSQAMADPGGMQVVVR